MRTRAPTALLVSVALAACASGPSASPLGYAVPGTPDVTYLVGDTISIALQGLGLGQDAEIGARSAATYALHFERGVQGVAVTATIQSLAADVVMPMADPIAMDETALSGDFTFEVDGRGRVLSMSSPQADQVGGQVFAAPVLAHTLFPRLPGRVVATGDTWVDSVTYVEAGDAGETEVRSALTYTVLGESQSAGRSLLDVGFEGTATVTQDLDVQGASVTQASQVSVTGTMRWDAAASLLYESEMTMEGEGTVRVALLPAALPTRVRWLTRVRLQDR